MHERPIIAITMGDPTGVGPEIVAQALASRDRFPACRPWIVGDLEAVRKACRILHLDLEIRPFDHLDEGFSETGCIPLLHVSSPPGRLVISLLETAADLALNEKVSAIVTAPIRKTSLKIGRRQFPGHTEFFAHRAGVSAVGMMLVGGPLRVMLATTHLPLAAVPRRLTPERILSAIRLCHQGLRESFGIETPRIAVAAFNPHAGEGGLFGREEETRIRPAVEAARREGIQASLPIPADTAFRQTAAGEYDAVVSLYHDQGLIPVKLLAFGRAVNLTVGLPFIRTSVDHGTADDLAGKGQADPGSLIAAIELAIDLVHRRQTVRS